MQAELSVLYGICNKYGIPLDNADSSETGCGISFAGLPLTENEKKIICNDMFQELDKLI